MLQSKPTSVAKYPISWRLRYESVNYATGLEGNVPSSKMNLGEIIYSRQRKQQANDGSVTLLTEFCN